NSTSLNELFEDCVADNVWARWIPVSYASHSPQIEGIRQQLDAALAPVNPQPARIRFYSTVTGKPAGTATLDSDYWYHNLRSPVLFEQTIRGMVNHGYRTFIEVSPHPVLTTAITQTIESISDDLGGAIILGSVTRDHGRLEDFLDAVGEAYVSGVE